MSSVINNIDTSPLCRNCETFLPRSTLRNHNIMPKDNFGNSYEYKSSGTNTSGNHFCARDFGSSAPNNNSYHYSNSDGSYYYKNPDGSSYYNPGSSGKGSVTYTPPPAKGE